LPAAVTSPERRQITIMFCDMVGSSALSTKLDPEEQCEVVGTFQACCSAEINRLGGMVAQYLGDGILAYFGYPSAHEQDAERAVRAGLAVLDAMASLRPTRGVTLQARIGIASGVVVVGDLVRESVTQENAAIGETTNLAARLQSLAEPNTLVISAMTQRLVGGLFDYRDLGRHTLKGFAKPVQVHQVLSASAVENRFEARHEKSSPPLVGRDDELDLLARHWSRTKLGQGHLVMLIGEPGIGKSRIVRALQERLAAEQHTLLQFHCSPHHRSSALYPVIGHLLRAAAIERRDTAVAKLAKLEVLLTPSSESLAEDMAVFAALLSIPGGEHYSLPSLAPQQLKELTLGALIAHLKRLSSRQPMVLVFEDLHWIDPTTLELLGRIIEQASELPLLMLVTARPEFVQPWPNYRHVSIVTMSRLDRAESQALVAAMTNGKALPVEVLNQIVAHTDGVPLFIEELTKTVLESGLLRDAGDRYDLTAPLPLLAIPSTLHASLLARLDRLASVKDIAQIAAAIGREFSYRLVAAVSALPERELIDALGRLVAAELIFQRGMPPDATYWFRHALVQDAAYDSLVRSRRHQLHNQIARALEEQFASIVQSQPEQLAHHYAEAGQWEKATIYSLEAGQLAYTRAAFPEAIAHFERGLTAAKELADSSRRLRLELDLTAELAAALRSIRGYAGAQVEDRYLRALELSQRADDFDKRLNVEWGLMQCNLVKGDLGRANQYAIDLLQHADHHPDKPYVDAHLAAGMVRFHMGDFEAARASFERGAALTAPARDEPNFFTHGQNPGAFCLSYLAWTLWFLGYPDAAKAKVDEILELMRARAVEPSHIYSHVSTLTFGVRVHQCCRDVAVVESLAEDLVRMARHHHYAYYEALGMIQRGWARATERSPTTGLQQMQDGLSALERTGTKLGLRGCYLQLAERYAQFGKKEDALAALDKSLGTKGSGTRCWDAEIERVRGEALALDPGPDPSEAETAFCSSLSIAHRQKAHSLELRTAISYARFLQLQHREADAHEVLYRSLAGFKEEDESADLSVARSMIPRLVVVAHPRAE
jgi:class 3 adenylate cyclase/tetratricopeptide (TPR) repeat protein